ncbi:MAG TPA: phytanoyl-CoA dioxygenase family protein, partial [Chthonomonadales bacterium]|nr:phytanoyl-CoA dioxygenase family protein [Chthonomonadales bacterium]
IGFLALKDEAARQFVLSPRFGAIAAQLMEVDAVRLYHDQALIKEAGGGHTPWHQDQYYWPLDTDNTITMWMALVDVTLEMGPIRFASGSHRDGYMGHVAISDESHERYEAQVQERGYPVVCRSLKAGDATFHSGWTLHAAGENRGGTDREVMTVIYYEDGVRIMNPPDNDARWTDLKYCLPGVQPGEPAVSEINPVVWTSSTRSGTRPG